MTRSFPSADRRARRRARWIVGVAATVYALVLAVAWTSGCAWQDRTSAELLQKARVEFVERLEGMIHAVQWSQACMAFDALGGWTNAAPRSVTEMRAIAKRLYIDELNIVSSNGVVIASNLPKVVGDDWRRSPQTAAFLEMFSPTAKLAQMSIPRLSQPFRHGTANPEYYCTYFGECFLDRSGLLQLGYTMERLIDIMTYSDSKTIREWRFGRHGHYLAIDMNGDSAPDAIPMGVDIATLERGILGRTVTDGGDAYRLTFSFAGHLFAAILPDCEFGGQRLYGFIVFAATSALLILLFAIVLMRLVHAARKVDALRREADARAAADMAVARKIQLSTLPDAATFAPEELALELVATTRPAREVGGDYYDFFRSPDGRIALVVADVSGKGIPAALFMQEAKHAFADALRVEGELAAAVTRMNGNLCSHNEAEMFVTAWFGLLDVVTGALEYVNAGHNRPYLLPAGGAPMKLTERGGRFIGTFPDATYRASRRQLAPGDRLVLFTDGVTEAMDAENHSFGEKRLEALLASHPADIVATTIAAVAAHAAGAEPSDDLTLLVAGWLGNPSSVTRMFAVDPDTPGACVGFLQEQVLLEDRGQKARLVNAADELVANVVAHSEAKTLTAEVSLAGGRCRVVLADDGRPYNPFAHRGPDMQASPEDRQVRGLGILMVKKLVGYAVWTHDGEKNRTTVVQRDRP